MTELSLIIPAYNAGAFFEDSLRRLQEMLATRPAWELIIVDDGSSDRTQEISALSLKDIPRARNLRLSRNQGKGAALRAGMREARGAFVAFTDADLPYGLAVFDAMLAQMRQDERFALLYGSRSHTHSVQSGYGLIRVLGRRFFGGLIRAIMPDVADTQCGIKLFRKELAQKIVEKGRIDGFAADIEFFVIARAEKQAYRDFPVLLTHRKESSVRLVRDSLMMLKDMMQIFYRRWRGDYV